MAGPLPHGRHFDEVRGRQKGQRLPRDETRGLAGGLAFRLAANPADRVPREIGPGVARRRRDAVRLDDFDFESVRETRRPPLRGGVARKSDQAQRADGDPKQTEPSHSAEPTWIVTHAA